jgi:sulfatase modifying factor 1
MTRYIAWVSVILVIQNHARAQQPESNPFENTVGMKFVRIASGEFTMGEGAVAPKSRNEWLMRDWDESPAHLVKISAPFFFGIHEVTNSQYERFDPDHKKLRGTHGASAADNEPVTFVTWKQAVDFCDWLSKKENKLYRLPTEAEWEYSCRAGARTRFSTGDTIDAAQANLGMSKTGDPINGPVAVGGYLANAWGLHDMHGNVGEWCFDWYGPYEAGEQVDPVGRADGDTRVCRGWSFLRTGSASNTKYTRCANRSGHLPDDANRCTGFRVVLGAMPKSKPLPVVVEPYQKNVRNTEVPKGPKPESPFFVNYPADETNPKIPRDSFGPVFSTWNHYGAVCVCPNGDVLAAWYTTVAEWGRECSQAVSRLRAGAERWEPVCSFLSIPDVNCHAPVLFCDGKRIYHFFTQSLNGWDDASDAMRFSDDSGATWSKPAIILPRTDPDALSQPCCCIKTKDGALVLACDGDNHKDERFLISKDDGKTWKVAKGDMRKSYGSEVIHPTIFQREDGAIVAFLRGSNPMPMLISKDQGDSYAVEKTKFIGIGTGQKAAVLKLQSGAVLMCSSDRTAKMFGSGSYAALSLDDGKTWPYTRKIETVNGYLALAQSPNGVIYLNGSQQRVVAFNEAWVKGK